MSNIQPGADPNFGSNEGLVVIGAPANTKLAFHAGDIKDGYFKADGFLPEGIVGNAESGYLVRKLKATGDGRGYGLVSIRTEKGNPVRCGHRIPVLVVDVGRVQYFGDLSYRYRSESAALNIELASNLSAAKEYMAKSFPTLAPQLTEGRVEHALLWGCP